MPPAWRPQRPPTVSPLYGDHLRCHGRDVPHRGDRLGEGAEGVGDHGPRELLEHLLEGRVWGRVPQSIAGAHIDGESECPRLSETPWLRQMPSATANDRSDSCRRGSSTRTPRAEPNGVVPDRKTPISHRSYLPPGEVVTRHLRSNTDP